MNIQYCPAITQRLPNNFAAQLSGSLFPTFSSFLKFHNLPVLPSCQHLVTMRRLILPETHLFLSLRICRLTYTCTFTVTGEVSAPKGPLLEISIPALLIFSRTSLYRSDNLSSLYLSDNYQLLSSRTF